LARPKSHKTARSSFRFSTQFRRNRTTPAFTFQKARGQLVGNQAQITFYDSYGEITLNGFLNSAGSTFDGSISYDNNVNFDGSTPGAAGTLGSFSIPVCSFFSCQ